MPKEVVFRFNSKTYGTVLDLAVPDDVSWETFQNKVQFLLGSEAMKIKYIDSDDDEVCLDSPEELQEALQWMSRKPSGMLELQSGSRSSVNTTKEDLQDAEERNGNIIKLRQRVDAHFEQESAAAKSSDSNINPPPWFREAIEQLKSDLLSELSDRRRHDLHADQLFDSTQTEHTGVVCDNCDALIVGVRYKCGLCVNFDLCEACEQLDMHPQDHAFIKLRRTSGCAGRTVSGRLVPLLVGSPYRLLPAAESASGMTSDIQGESDMHGSGAANALPCGDRLSRKLEKIGAMMAKNGQMLGQLQQKEEDLKQRLSKLQQQHLSRFTEDNVDNESKPASLDDSGTFSPGHKQMMRKLDKIQRNIGKTMHEAERLQQKQCKLWQHKREQKGDGLGRDKTATGRINHQKLKAIFLRDETVPDGTKLACGTKFVKRWMLKNAGTMTWDHNSKLQLLWGNIPAEGSEVCLPHLAPGQQGVVSVEFIAPEEEGHYRSAWRASHFGKKFGHEFWCSIKATARVQLNVNEDSACGSCVDEQALHSMEGAVDIPTCEADKTGSSATAGSGDHATGVACITAVTDDASELYEASDAVDHDLVQISRGRHAAAYASSQTATPNNTPLGMSPPKSPEPVMLAWHMRVGKQGNASSAEGMNSAGVATESCHEHLDVDSDECYDDEDFCIVPVPPCFILSSVYETAPASTASRLGESDGGAMRPSNSLYSMAAAPTEAAPAIPAPTVLTVAMPAAAAVSSSFVTSGSNDCHDTVLVGKEDRSQPDVSKCQSDITSGSVGEDAATPDQQQEPVTCEDAAKQDQLLALESLQASVMASQLVEPSSDVSQDLLGVQHTGHEPQCGVTGQDQHEQGQHPDLWLRLESGQRCHEQARQRESSLLHVPSPTTKQRSLTEFALSKVRDVLDFLKIGDEDGKATENELNPSDVSARSLELQEKSPMEELVEMGFANRPLNQTLLEKHGGNVEAVISELLDNLDSNWHFRRH